MRLAAVLPGTRSEQGALNEGGGGICLSRVRCSHVTMVSVKAVCVKHTQGHQPPAHDLDIHCQVERANGGGSLGLHVGPLQGLAAGIYETTAHGPSPGCL